MDYEEILRAYNQALKRGADRAALDAEVQRTTGLSGGQALRSQALSWYRHEAVVRSGPALARLDREFQQRTGMTPREIDRAVGNRSERHSSRMLAQGLTLGFADELVGLGAAVVPGGRGYTEGRDASRASLAEARREEGPVSSFATEGLGGLLLPGVGAENVGRRVLARTGSRVLAGAAGGAAGGATGGAVYGAGDAEGGVPSRIRGALTGGVLGGALGAGLGGITALAGRTLGRLRGVATVRAEDTANRVLRRELEAAGHTPESVMGHLRQMGEGSVVADLGENLGREARAAVNTAPSLAAPGGPVQRIRARSADTRNRVADAIRRATGLTRSFEESLEAAEAAIRQVRQQHYGPLEQEFPAVTGPRIQAVLADPRVAAVAEQVAPGVAAGPGPRQAPSFTQLQDVMMALRDDVTAARAAGRPNASRRAAEAYDALVEAMQAEIPGFQEAQQAYHVAVSRVDAHELGRLAANRPPSDIRRELRRLPPEAHDAYRQGMLDAVETRLRRREGTAAGDWLNAGATTRELGGIMAGDEGRAQGLFDQMTNQEQPWAATGRAVTGNSTTPQQMADADGMLADIPTSARDVISRLVDYAVGPNPRDRVRAAEIIGRALLSEGPDAAQAVAEAFRHRPVGAGLFGGTLGRGAAQAARASFANEDQGLMY